jgi:hypothetical protein
MDNSYRQYSADIDVTPKRALNNPGLVAWELRVELGDVMGGADPILPTFRWLPDEHLPNGLLRVSAEVLAW